MSVENLATNPATEERLRAMALDLEEQFMAKHDQAVREITDYVVDKYFPRSTIQEREAIAKRLVLSFDKFISNIYLEGTSTEFEY